VSEEIASANHLLIELARVRSDKELILAALHQVEAALSRERADNARLLHLARSAVEVVRGLCYSDGTDAAIKKADRWMYGFEKELHAPHPGAALLAELTAARKVVARWREMPPYYDDCDPGQNDPYYAWCADMDSLVVAYDAAVKARGE